MKHSYWFIFFVVSGFCGLLYETVWLRLAMSLYGVTTPLVSMVLSIFMGGLALGNWGAGVWLERHGHRSPALGLRLYGAAEAAAALSATLVPALLLWGRTVLVAGSNEWGSSGYHLASGAFLLLALTPFCACMGATFPLGLFVLRQARDREAARNFSFLYLANVSGAAMGTVVTAFVLIELLGFSGTLAVAAAANAALAATALCLSLSPEANRRPDQVAGEAADVSASAAATPVVPRVALAALFVTGLVSMGAEIVWLRLLTPYLGNVVYCFAAVLGLYLCATALGSALYRKWIRGSDSATSVLTPWVCTALFVTALVPLAAADPRLGIGEMLRHGSPHLQFTKGLIRAVLAVVPFCAALGFVTPMLMDAWSQGQPRRAGAAYGFNILGCIVGPLVSGFLLLPWAGERGAVGALASPLLAGVFLSPVPSVGRRMRHAGFPAVASFAAAALLLGLSRGYETAFPDAVIRRDSTATVAALGHGRDMTISVNGVGTSHLTPVTKMMAHLPLAFFDGAPQSALVICFGMGTSYRSALSWGVETTAVELIPSVPQLFSYFHADGEALLRSPRGRVVIDDGRRFLERSPRSFDVITLDPPPPVEAAGSSLLYSRQFYEVARRRLTERGILQQWIPADEPVVVVAFLKAVLSSFPHVRAFGSVEGWGLHILASRSPIPARTAADLASRLPAAAAADLVEWGPWPEPVGQFGAVLASEVSLAQLLAKEPQAPVLVDDRPINEYFVLRRFAPWNR